MRPRSWAVTSRQPSKARRAAATAASTSFAPASGTLAMTSSVAGFMTSKVLPEAAGTKTPSISIAYVFITSSWNGGVSWLFSRLSLGAASPSYRGRADPRPGLCVPRNPAPRDAAPRARLGPSGLAGDREGRRRVRFGDPAGQPRGRRAEDRRRGRGRGRAGRGPGLRGARLLRLPHAGPLSRVDPARGATPGAAPQDRSLWAQLRDVLRARIPGGPGAVPARWNDRVRAAAAGDRPPLVGRLLRPVQPGQQPPVPI